MKGRCRHCWHPFESRGDHWVIPPSDNRCTQNSTGRHDIVEEIEQESLLDGDDLKRLGMQQALDGARTWKDQAEIAIRTLAETGTRFTSEDVVALVGLPTG